jgi:hypothetical protein
MAAAVATNLFVALVALIYPIAYVFLQRATGLRERIVLAVKDAVAFGLGAADLIAVLGVYASLNGGSFVYFQAQIDLARTGDGDAFKVPNYEWLRTEPRLLVPLFLLAVATPFLVVGRRRPPFRFAAASIAGLAFLTAAIYCWEFAAGGAALEYTYYFSYFLVSIALVMSSFAALAVSVGRRSLSASVGVSLVVMIASVAALGLIYHDQGEREEQADENSRQLQSEVAETENRIAVSRQVYNDTVLTYNNAVQTVPGTLVAGPFGFSTREFFDVEDDAQREAPQVSFTPGTPTS